MSTQAQWTTQDSLKVCVIKCVYVRHSSYVQSSSLQVLMINEWKHVGIYQGNYVCSNVFHSYDNLFIIAIPISTGM